MTDRQRLQSVHDHELVVRPLREEIRPVGAEAELVPLPHEARPPGVREVVEVLLAVGLLGERVGLDHRYTRRTFG